MCASRRRPASNVIAGWQSRHERVGAGQIDRAQVLVRPAISDVVVRIFGRDGDRAHRAGHIGVGKVGRHHKVIGGLRG